jgi:hypothetical protein
LGISRRDQTQFLQTGERNGRVATPKIGGKAFLVQKLRSKSRRNRTQPQLEDEDTVLDKEVHLLEENRPNVLRVI